ncbi:hypothetical protein D3C80_1094830 [compost metagenome]
MQKAIDLFPVVSEGLRYPVKVTRSAGKSLPCAQKQRWWHRLVGLADGNRNGAAIRILIPLIGQAGAERMLDALNKVQEVSDESAAGHTVLRN